MGMEKVQFGNHWPHAVGPTIAVLGQVVFIASNKVVGVDVKNVRVSESSITYFSVMSCYLTFMKTRSTLRLKIRNTRPSSKLEIG